VTDALLFLGKLPKLPRQRIGNITTDAKPSGHCTGDVLKTWNMGVVPLFADQIIRINGTARIRRPHVTAQNHAAPILAERTYTDSHSQRLFFVLYDLKWRIRKTII
jgi:hypothetical protein